ncbi:hypothetical protein Pelo_15026 [Pelomyxa schiedti]|nr:hypothetical protein Pelo_15026 [Pelomyxa schiedti]
MSTETPVAPTMASATAAAPTTTTTTTSTASASAAAPPVTVAKLSPPETGFSTNIEAANYWIEICRPVADLIWLSRLDEADAALADVVKEHIYPGSLHVLSGFWRSILTESALERSRALARIEKLEDMVKPNCVGYKRSLVKHGAAKLYRIATTGHSGTTYTPAQWDEMFVQTVSMMIMGMLLLGKALLHYYDRSYANAPFLLRKSWKWLYRAQYLKDFLMADPVGKTYVIPEMGGDIAFGVGIFHLIMTAIPPTFMWFLQLMGFEADLPLALAELDEAWQSGASFGSGGAMLLSWVYTMLLKDPEKARSILHAVSARKARSPLLCYTEGYQTMLAGDIETSRACFRESRALFSPEFDFMRKSCTYFEGATYYVHNDWERAIPCIEEYLATESTMYRCHGFYKLAICKWCTGQRDQVADILARGKACAKEHYEHDDFTVMMANKFVSNGNAFTDFDIYLERLNNFLDGHYYQEAFEECGRYKIYISGTPGPEPLWLLEAWLHFWLGCSLAGLRGRDDEALLEFTKVVGTEPQLKALFFDYQIVAYSLVEMGEMALRTNHLKEATEYFGQARSKSNYMFSKYIDYRIKSGNYFIYASKANAVVSAMKASSISGSASGTTAAIPTGTGTESTAATATGTSPQREKSWHSSVTRRLKLL